jgi:adenylate kinase
MRGETIVVFGISGAGKTSSCLTFVKGNPEYLHLSASELLRGAAAADPASLRISPADQILENQKLLPSALRARREGQWHRPVLIDAHSVIDNDRELVRIPVEVIRSLDPDGLLLMEAAPEIIAARRSEPGSRRPARSIDQIVREAEVARQAVLEPTPSSGGGQNPVTSGFWTRFSSASEANCTTSDEPLISTATCSMYWFKIVAIRRQPSASFASC